MNNIIADMNPLITVLFLISYLDSGVHEYDDKKSQKAYIFDNPLILNRLSPLKR